MEADSAQHTTDGASQSDQPNPSCQTTRQTALQAGICLIKHGRPSLPPSPRCLNLRGDIAPMGQLSSFIRCASYPCFCPCLMPDTMSSMRRTMHAACAHGGQKKREGGRGQTPHTHPHTHTRECSTGLLNSSLPHPLQTSRGLAWKSGNSFDGTLLDTPPYIVGPVKPRAAS